MGKEPSKYRGQTFCLAKCLLTSGHDMTMWIVKTLWIVGNESKVKKRVTDSQVMFVICVLSEVLVTVKHSQR